MTAAKQINLWEFTGLVVVGVTSDYSTVLNKNEKLEE